MKSDFLVALTQLAAERNLPREIVLSAIEAALASAYRKDNITAGQNISVSLDPGSGDVSVSVVKTIVEEVEDPLQEILMKDAVKIKPGVELGDTVATESISHTAGRIAAQTAKQVVMQRLREAERELVYEEFSDKEGEVFTVNVQRIEPRQIIVDLGRAEAILPMSEQVMNERNRPGQKIKILLQRVERSSRGPELIVSRADKLLLKRLFEMEVPEIYNGAVEIVAIAREPGARSKVAVRARQDGVDPVGSCVGLRGVRIQNIVNELQGEKIDVVEWSRDTSRFIINALSPSQVLRAELDEETQSAIAVVPERHLSLAIGKEGQNARLAAKLTGWNVDIKSNVEMDGARPSARAEKPTIESDLEALVLSTRTLNVLKKAEIVKIGQAVEMTQEELLAVSGFGQKSYDELYGRLKATGLLAPVVAPEAEPAVEEAPVAEVAEPVVQEPVVEEAVAEPEPVADEPVQEPAAEVVVAEPPVEAPVEEVPAEPAPVEEAATPEELLVEAEEEPEPVVVDRSASIHDLPDTVWTIPKAAAVEPGRIRFAEDIVGLRGGVTARRERKGGPRKRRKAKAGRRR